MKNPSKNDKRFQRDWFAAGGRHGLNNRISDLQYFLRGDFSDKTCLDVGCAEGDIIDYLHERFARLDGIEKSRRLYEQARKRFAGNEKVHIYHNDIATCDMPRTYDVVLHLGVLHYFPDEATRSAILEQALLATRQYLFVRTSFLEKKQARTQNRNTLDKSTHLKTVATLAAKHEARWLLLDNSYRGEGNRRLGDLLVIQKIKPGLDADAAMFRDLFGIAPAGGGAIF